MPKFESWQMGAAVRKATRQTPIDDAPRTRGVPNKRNTKRWCRGKVGVEHKPAVKTFAELKNWRGVGSDSGLTNAFRGWIVRYCSDCGKELDSYHPPFDVVLPLLRKPHVVPEWAAAYFVEHPEYAPQPSKPVRR